jgi:hypothetical protein
MVDTDMAINFTALAGLDRTFTVGVEEEAMAGEDMVGIETEIIYPDQRPGCWYYCNNPKGVGLFGKMLILKEASNVTDSSELNFYFHAQCLHDPAEQSKCFGAAGHR